MLWWQPYSFQFKYWLNPPQLLCVVTHNVFCVSICACDGAELKIEVASIGWCSSEPSQQEGCGLRPVLRGVCMFSLCSVGSLRVLRLPGGLCVPYFRPELAGRGSSPPQLWVQDKRWMGWELIDARMKLQSQGKKKDESRYLLPFCEY